MGSRGSRRGRGREGRQEAAGEGRTGSLQVAVKARLPGRLGYMPKSPLSSMKRMHQAVHMLGDLPLLLMSFHHLDVITSLPLNVRSSGS
eukprot:711472-Hanusia_phi.AAC.1